MRILLTSLSLSLVGQCRLFGVGDDLWSLEFFYSFVGCFVLLTGMMVFFFFCVREGQSTTSSLMYVNEWSHECGSDPLVYLDFYC